VHVHMECEVGGTRRFLNCYQGVYGGSSWIYRFLVES
jgi:hypothetical protein